MIHTGLVGNTERKEILEDLTTRGLFQDSTDQTALKERLNEGPITLYCGFDPTADSLHLGSGVVLHAQERSDVPRITKELAVRQARRHLRVTHFLN